jgi:benzil reductase ((S)-benzoin forming)
MNYYFITGTSRGIGKAIAQQLLLDPQNYVFGLSRTNTIEHERFSFHEIDLSEEEQVSKWEFPVLKDADKICLVNNAGAIGSVKHAGKMEMADMTRAFYVNLVAPTIFCNSFLKTYSAFSAQQIIINVSSGAGKNPIDGWSVYCATKAGLDMYTKTLAEELKIDGKKIFSHLQLRRVWWTLLCKTRYELRRRKISAGYNHLSAIKTRISWLILTLLQVNI